MNLRKNSAITLIALVITIIVLLILAGVSLSLISGGDGILNKATNAVKETNSASAKEQAEMFFAECKTGFYEEKYVNRNDVESIKKYLETKIGENGIATGDCFITMDNSGNITVYSGNEAKAGNEVVFGTLLADGKVSWIGDVEIPEGLEVGSEVSYTPSGTYTEWTTAHSGYETSYILASGSEFTDANTQTDMTISSWKVFDVNKNTGEVKLVPSAPTTATVGLKGADGYNNAVKLLNDTCSSLYGKAGVTARSINIDDIEKVLEYDKTTYSNSYASYGGQKTDAYTTNKTYPAIYAEEIDSVIEPIPEGKNKTLGLNKAASDWIIGSVANAISIQPKQTYYKLENSDFTSKLKGSYSTLLLTSGSSTNYWVASRCVILASSTCNFLVRNVYSGGVDAEYMFNSENTTANGARPLFPILSLNINQITGDATSGWSIQ